MKYNPEEKGTLMTEEAMTHPNVLMEVDKALKEVGTFFTEFNFDFIDERAQNDFDIASDDYKKCTTLFENIIDRYTEVQDINEDDLLAILAIISEIKLFVISNIKDGEENDPGLFSNDDSF